ncbi:MAG: hypothetical protein QOJ40_1842 [Verrucomicrobiota bacterium]
MRRSRIGFNHEPPAAHRCAFSLCVASCMRLFQTGNHWCSNCCSYSPLKRSRLLSGLTPVRTVLQSCSAGGATHTGTVTVCSKLASLRANSSRLHGSALFTRRGGACCHGAKEQLPSSLQARLGERLCRRHPSHLKRSPHNKRPGVDAGWRVLFACSRLWPRATQAGC